MDDRRTSPPRIATTLVVVVAVILQLMVAIPVTAAIGLVAPLWGVVLAWLLWVVSAAALYALARRRPLFTPAIPVVNAVLLFALVTAGELWFGWTA